MIKLAAEIIFYGLLGILGLYSVMMVYVLVRYGKSKILALVASAFYAIILTTLYGAALANFAAIRFPNIDFLL